MIDDVLDPDPQFEEKPDMTPLEFQPILKRTRWGGRRLATLLGKPIGDGADWAESWEISDHGEDQSVVRDGPYAGWTLHRLIEARNRPLLGRHAGRSQFPLLVKFLDANDRLSVQVHPNDERAPHFQPGENGKTEAWIILHAEPGSALYVGLRENVDRRALQEHLENGTVEGCLHRFRVEPGDCVFLPAGTVHAIGEGIVLAEIQQPSDLTFRLYDWGRLGSDGNPRPLHIAEALECIDFRQGPGRPVVPQRIADAPTPVEELVRCDHFVIRRHRSAEPFSTGGDERFRVLMMLSGKAEVRCAEESRPMTLGTTLLIPAAAGNVELIPDGESVVLESFLA